MTLKSNADGSELALDAILNNGDTLIVVSADTTNTTKYVLEVTTSECITSKLKILAKSLGEGLYIESIGSAWYGYLNGTVTIKWSLG